MITVPSCQPCNKKKSAGEPHLRLYVNSQLGGSQHPDAFWHIEQLVTRSQVTRNQMEKMLRDAEPISFVTDSGIIVEQGIRTDFDKAMLEETLRMMVRGLYFDTHKQPLPYDAPVEVAEIPISLFFQMMRRMGLYREFDPIPKGNLVFWHSFLSMADGEPHDRLCLMCFNDGVAFQAATGRAALIKRQVDENQSVLARKAAGRRRLITRLLPAQVRVPREMYTRRPSS